MADRTFTGRRTGSPSPTTTTTPSPRPQIPPKPNHMQQAPLAAKKSPPPPPPPPPASSVKVNGRTASGGAKSVNGSPVNRSPLRNEVNGGGAGRQSTSGAKSSGGGGGPGVASGNGAAANGNLKGSGNGKNAAAVEPIAIVGMGCRLPGDSNTPSQFWSMLEASRSGQTRLPPSRFNISAFHHPSHLRPGSIEASGGYFLHDDVRQFDPSFFGITPLEATTLDPQQRKLLEVVYESFESGGVTLEGLSGSNTGVFVANFTSDFQTMQYRDPEYALLQPYLLTGMGLTMLSNRVSYVFNLLGPSLTVDTACSSSIYALHLACQSIQDGTCDAAVVAGTNLIMTVDQHMASAKLGVLSPTSQCHTFDAAADGYARGEGVSALYVKRLSDAIRDGDPIRAVVRGSAFNANGRSAGGITNPSPAGQERVIRDAYARAGLLGRLGQTGYFECHGTGTAVGDPLEVAAIGKVFAEGRELGRNELLVGSVKTNVGHGEAASGITSVIKCVLALEKGVIPPTIGLVNKNPGIDFDGARVKVVTELCSWPAHTGGVRRASINSFGYGGANAHAILDATPEFYKTQTQGGRLVKGDELSELPGEFGSVLMARQQNGAATKKRFLLPFSAHDLPTLKANVAAVREVVAEYDMLDLAYTLGCRRSRFYHRGYSIVDTSAGAELSIAEQLEEEEITFGRKSGSTAAGGGALGFIFTGQGAQWARMGADLLSEYPSFLATIRHLDAILAHLPSGETPDGWTLESALLEPGKTSRINEVAISQPICTAVQIGLIELFSGWGINPAAVVGHSSGEIAAAYAAGKISMEAAIIIAYYRGYCCTAIKIPTPGAMLAVGLGEESVLPYLEPYIVKGTVRVACVNSPKSVTLSGDKADIEAVKSVLEEESIFARLLQTGGRAYHSHHMKLVGPMYEHKLNENVRVGGYGTYRTGTTLPEMFSSVTMEPLTAAHIPNHYWRQNLESPVLFSQALSNLIKDPSNSIDNLIELGPHSALSGPVRDVRESLSISSSKLTYTPSLIRGQDSVVSVLTLCGTLFMRDYLPLDLARVNSVEKVDPKSGTMSVVRGKTLVDLPAYRWTYSAETLHWNENRVSEEWRNRTHARHDLLGSRVPGSAEGEPVWRNVVKVKYLPWIEGHKVGDAIIFPAAGYISMAVEAATQVLEMRALSAASNTMETIKGYRLRNVSVKAAMRIPPSDPGVEVMFNMRPLAVTNTRTSQYTFEFKVSSVVGGKWAENASGSVTVLMEKKEPYRKWTHPLTHSGTTTPFLRTTSTPHKKWYTAFSAIGLNYGPTFSGLRNIKLMPTHSLATATTPLNPTDGVMDGPESRYVVHPCTIDTFLQAGLIACHAKGGVGSMNRCYLPVGFEEITIFTQDPEDGNVEEEEEEDAEEEQNVNDEKEEVPTSLSQPPSPTTTTASPAGEVAHILATARKHGMRTLIGNVQARIPSHSSGSRTPQSTLLMDIKDLRCLTVDSRTSLAQTTPEALRTRSPFLRLHWKPSITHLTRAQASTLFPGTHIPALPRVWEDWQTLSLLMLLQITAEVPSKSMVTQRGEEWHLRHWYGWMQRRISQAKGGAFGGIWGRVKGLVSAVEREGEILRLKESLEKTVTELQLIYNVYTQIPAILRGEVSGVQVVMVDNVAPMTESYTQGLRHSGACRQLGKIADLLGHWNPTMRVLEIGAGTGGATQIMLDGLGGKSGLWRRYSRYDFTDVSKGFLGNARERFREYGGVEFGVLDVEVDPVTQGWEEGGYDLVVSSNCLHATRNINNTIANVRKLLKKDGHLLILEVTEDTFSGSLLYGALPSYWCSVEDGRVDHPFLSKSKWHEVFMKNGFSGLDIALDDYEGHSEPTSVMLTRAVDLEGQEGGRNSRSGSRTGASCESESGDGEEKGTRVAPEIALVYRNACPALLDAVASYADTQGISYLITPLTAYPTLPHKPSTTVVFSDIEDPQHPLLTNITDPELQGFQTIVSCTSHILWLTAGGLITGSHPEHALIYGTARTIKSENNGLKFMLLDLDLDDPALAGDLATQTHLVWQRWAELHGAGDVHEREYCVKDGMVHISRVTGDEALNADFQLKQMHDGIVPVPQPYDHTVPMVADIEQPGLLDTFFFKPDAARFERQVRGEEVDVDVVACGLAMKDLLTVLGTFDTPCIGLEYSGRVRAVGEKVKGLRVGDKVAMVYKGHFNSRIREKEGNLIKVREEDKFEEVASVLVSYSTALYGIVDLARARKGEKILVHGGTSSLGMACIEVSQHLGLEIYATVSSDSKSLLLQTKYGLPPSHIFNSKSPSFSTAVLSVTDEYGIDIIISTISGELISESTVCLAKYGRFIDVGRSDVHDHGKLDLECFRKNTVFHSFDLDTVREEEVRRLARQTIELLQRGVINAIKPIEEFHITEVSAAMRRFGQRTEPGGKIVVTFGPAPKKDAMVRVQTPATHLQFDPDAAYLLVGCLGGLGRSLSRWMVSRGARHLYFLARSGSDRPEARLLAEELTASGAIVTIIRGDISCYHSVETALTTITQPIKGVVQAAMVLKDSLFTNMTATSFHTATAAKVKGTMNLHTALLARGENAPLEFFVMTSSVSGYIGYLSQSNYAAANAFLDSMARYRRSLGLPATSIALGVIEEVGYVSEKGTAEFLAAMHRSGLASSDEAEFLTHMEAAMMTPHGQVGRASSSSLGGEQQDNGDGVAGVIDPHWDAYILTGLEPSKMMGLGVRGASEAVTSTAIETIVGAQLTADVRSRMLMQTISTLRTLDTNSSSTSTTASTTANTTSISDLKALAMQPGEAGITALVNAIRTRLAVLLMLDVEQVEDGKTVMEYGLDSMVGAELRNWLFTVFRVQIPFLELLDPGLSIRGLGERVRGKMSVK